MRLAMVLMLVGCGWGQDGTAHWIINDQKVEMVGDQYHPMYVIFAHSGLRIQHEVGESAREGDCYKVQQDMTLQKCEPMDVPAVEVTAESHAEWVSSGGLAMERCTNGGKLEHGQYLDGCTGGHITNCADKRRILLTGEDGVKHCILFPATGEARKRWQ